MKGIRVGCVLEVGQESPADDDSACDYQTREKKEYGRKVDTLFVIIPCKYIRDETRLRL